MKYPTTTAAKLLSRGMRMSAADPFQTAMEMAEVCSMADFQSHENMVRYCFDNNIAEDRRSYLFAVASKRSGVPIKAIRDIDIALRNTVNDQVCNSPDAAADVYCAGLKAEHDHVIYDEGALFIYDTPLGEVAVEDEGFYCRISDDDLRADLRANLGRISPLRTDAGERAVDRKVKAKVAHKGYFTDAPAGLNCDNGFVAWDATSGELVLQAHDPKHKARSRAPVVFDRDAEAPTFLEGLSRVLPDDMARAALQEFIGAVLFGVLPEKDNVRRMLVLLGATRSGKSTLIEVLLMLFPAFAVASVPPEDWSSEFERARLSGVAINVCTELKAGKLP